jgi:hypothetical protein
VALLKLRQNGECFVAVPEAVFDADYPGHYFRRLNSVALTIPCTAGRLTTVACTLTWSATTCAPTRPCWPANTPATTTATTRASALLGERRPAAPGRARRLAARLGGAGRRRGLGRGCGSTPGGRPASTRNCRGCGARATLGFGGHVHRDQSRAHR